MPAGNLERVAAKDRLRSDNGQRCRAEICSAGFEENQIGRENKPLALTLSPLWRGEGIQTLVVIPGCAARHPLLAKRGEGRGEELEFFPTNSYSFEFR